MKSSSLMMVVENQYVDKRLILSSQHRASSRPDVGGCEDRWRNLVILLGCSMIACIQTPSDTAINGFRTCMLLSITTFKAFMGFHVRILCFFNCITIFTRNITVGFNTFRICVKEHSIDRYQVISLSREAKHSDNPLSALSLETISCLQWHFTEYVSNWEKSEFVRVMVSPKRKQAIACSIDDSVMMTHIEGSMQERLNPVRLQLS